MGTTYDCRMVALSHYCNFIHKVTNSLPCSACAKLFEDRRGALLHLSCRYSPKFTRPYLDSFCLVHLNNDRLYKNKELISFYYSGKEKNERLSFILFTLSIGNSHFPVITDTCGPRFCAISLCQIACEMSPIDPGLR